MLFRLARELGKTVADLEAGLSVRELTEWYAFFRIESEDG